MENADTTVQKVYFGGQEQKPAEFNRVEFASKALVTRIQNTQNFFVCAANENAHISVEDLWLAALADVISQSPKPKADNDELLEQLKIAERQLGLSAQKVKRALCQSQIINAASIVGGAALAVASASAIIYVIAAFGFKTVTALVFITALTALCGLGIFMTHRALGIYNIEKSKMKTIDRQTKNFLQNKNGQMNHAQIFILNRVQSILPEIMLK